MEIVVCLACSIMLMICIHFYTQTIELTTQLNKIETIIQDDGRHYYIICPECGRKIVLTDVQILVLEDEYNKK